VCPKCDAQVRHRLFWAILNIHKKYNKENVILNKRILHFAPEKNLRINIQKLSSDYKTADFFAESYQYSGIDYNIDISDMKVIENEVFDCVIVFDVLEHVVDDRKALKELNRITKTGGLVILTVPMKDSLKVTYEDASITDPEQRELAFGQFDHLRIYGEDFIDRIREQGFDVEIVDHILFDENTIKRHVLFPPVLSAHPLATNYRKLYFGTKV
jgi:SAM-dependent methyltransferase